MVSESGIATDPVKTEKVSNWPVPVNCKQLQTFLGLPTYYRRFVQDFAKIARPLYRLTQANTRDGTCQTAFDTLREKLVSAPILAFPDFSRSFILDTDASDEGIGVLSQSQEDAKEHVIAYASRNLTKTERKYSVTRKELLSVVNFIVHFRQYLLGSTFMLRTDHNALLWLQNFKNPEGQTARWLEKLQEYSFEIEHRPGHKHNNADALSRRPPVSATNISTDFVYDKCTGYATDLVTLQRNDPIIGPVIRAKEQGVQQPSSDMTAGYSGCCIRLFQLWDQLILEQGVLFRQFHDSTHNTVHCQLDAIKDEILNQLHAGSTGGYLGIEKTLSKLKKWLDITTMFKTGVH